MSKSSPGPRSYSSATVRALFTLSGTTCYFPDCPRSVVTFIDDEPFTEVQIAHIRAASSDGPRYDPDMTDDERRAFANLILLCTPHHELVDKRHPERYSVETLVEWKTGRETAMGIERQNLAGVNEDGLIEAILAAIASTPPQRKVVVELGIGYFGAQGLIEFPTETANQFVGLEQYKNLGNQILLLTVRNTGTLPAYWDGHVLYYHPCGIARAGDNYFPYDNPTLPCRLESGQSARWLYFLPEVSNLVAFMREKKLAIETLVAKVNLGSGESIESSPLSVAFLPN
ncbi:hypothetical protein ACSBOX_11605 [Arthrobacter sp. KN11-1C]|uniref:hypothetical protein n=1 Tax=Arthrobacter sp. KN11-1C TaxID=3445774 RepID=UPI003F9EE04D